MSRKVTSLLFKSSQALPFLLIAACLSPRVFIPVTIIYVAGTIFFIIYYIKKSANAGNAASAEQTAETKIES